MKILFLIPLIILISCSYNDIDTVPIFDEMKITNQESLELCKFSKNTNQSNYLDCLAKSIEDVPDFEILNLNEQESIKLCKIINTDIKKLIECFTFYYDVNN